MDYSSMSRAELEMTLKRLKGNLEDLEETISFNLTYSAAHIGGGQVRRDEESLSELKKQICRIEERLSNEEPG